MVLRLAVAVLTVAVGGSSQGADESLPPMVKAALDEVRLNRAEMYDVFESSTLGKTAGPSEFAATQRNMRAYYMTPAAALELSEARKAELGALYGRVALFGRPRAGKAFALGITGAHVIDVEHRPELVVTRVEPGTPAAGALEVGDVILGANQRLFPEWEDPRVPIGYGIAAAQTRAFDGVLTLHVGRDGKVMSVQVTLPVDGGYSANWPYDCAKSKAVTDAAVEYVIHRGDDTFWRNLFLMGAGDESALAAVRDDLRGAQTTGAINSNWGAAYKLISLCEYYLLTRDREVLPAIECHVRGLEANQMASGGWGHGAPGGYGVMNQVGQTCFMGLLLAKECGVEVNPTVLARAVGLSGRFIGAYGAYGDHPPTVLRYGRNAGFDNGIVPAHAVLFNLLGEPAVAGRSGRRACYLYRTQMAGHAERIFTIAWSGVGTALAPDPEFRMYADNMIWYYELARRRSGALDFPGHTRYSRNTAAVAMLFTLPERRLRISGAPRRSEPLFPIEKLEAVQAVPPRAPAALADVPESPAPDVAAVWDTLLAKNAGDYRVTDAGPLNQPGPGAWYRVDYDDSQWTAANGQTGIPRDSEGLLLRTTFHCERTTYDRLRLTLPAGVGGEIYLNGFRVAVFAKGTQARGGPAVQTMDLGARAARALVTGRNFLAVRVEGPGGVDVSIDLAAGPGVADNRTILPNTADFGNNNRNGWVGTYEQHRQSVAWFFEDKSPEQIARYLAFPDWNGAQAAYQALASHGADAVELLLKLVQDSHAGIRIGAWDAIAEMNGRGLLPEDAKGSFTALAASRLASEHPEVGQALGRAVAPMATGEDLAEILAGIAAMPDIKARELAANTAVQGLGAHPELMLGILRIITDAGLTDNDIRVLGNALGNTSRSAELPAARASVPGIARVLDQIAPETRGMFTDGLMHGGLPVIDWHFDAELEKTPLLASGMTRCFIRVPDSDWPGWAYANLYLRRLIYRLGPDSAATVRRTVELVATGPDAARGEAVRRDEPMAELRAWSAVLERTGGADGALRAEALRLADSNDPSERLVALSLVWPSQDGPLAETFTRRYRRDLADTARIKDPADRLAVAAKAATHLETNTPVHWLLIWETTRYCRDHPDSKLLMPALGEFLDQVAFRQRGTFMFDAIDSAAVLAKTQLGTPGETPTLARGLCKTYSTASNNGWYTRARDRLHEAVMGLGKSSAPAISDAVTAQRDWLQHAPAEDRAPVLNRDCPVAEVQKRLTELEDLAGRLSRR